MSIHLVRHAKANDRVSWSEPDAERPLSEAGRVQAQAIADRLEASGAARIVSSPAVRCRQTVAPLAERLGLTIVDHPPLYEGSPVSEALELLTDLPDRAVVCGHGDLIPAIVQALANQGMIMPGPLLCPKASTWSLDRLDGSFTEARYTPPPT